LKNLIINPINFIVIAMLFFSFDGLCQNAPNTTVMGTVITTGDDASGDYGSVSYSIGQVFYTYIGAPVYNVAQGIQHEEANIVLAVPDVITEPKTEIFIFPNPTTDYVTINIESSDFAERQRSYQLFDLQGRLMKQNAIYQNETQINLSYLSSSTYLLRVYSDNKMTKSFKIIKN
jgi:hypothetical protein